MVLRDWKSSYNFNGPREITAADLVSDDVEIVNPDAFLATLNEDAVLKLYGSNCSRFRLCSK